MKRFSSSESLGTMLYSPQEEKAKDNLVYSSEFQAMLDSLDDEECCIEENGHNGKKRRLSTNQVQALEKIFEVDNKLDPEKKLKLAQELNLQPRQVAIWFQNRRARWKTKQLERDYNLLKADYDNLKINHKKVEQEREKLVSELKILKKKLGEESSQNNGVSEQGNHGSFNNPETIKLNNSSELIINHEFNKDGSSDSTDSSGILLLNDQLNNNNNNNNQFLSIQNSCSSMYYHPQMINSRPRMIHEHQKNEQQQQRSLKTEELSLFSNLEETTTCNIFSVDQPPNLYWYFPDDQSI